MKDAVAPERAKPHETQPTSADLMALFQSRADSYRLFSRIFLKPLDDEAIEALAAADFVERSAAFESGSLLRQGFNNMGRGLRRRHTGTRCELATDYTMCFDGLSEANGEVAVPCESVFRGSHKEYYQEPWLEMQKLSKREGVNFDPATGVPSDHLALELEFMAALADRAEKAAAAGDDQCVAHTIKVSQEFLKGHLANWYPALRARAEALVTTRFYRGALEALDGYLALDQSTLMALA